jgi:hypothetical protein
MPIDEEGNDGYINFYRAEGVNIIPLNPSNDTKKPLIEWQKYQERKATDAEIEGWKEQTGRFAVVCGEISANLVILDIDAEELFEGLNLGAVAANTYTEERARRFHIFLRTTKPIATKSFKFNGKEDIGILSTGHLSTAGGTAHTKGGAYAHFITSPKEIKTVDAGFFGHLERLWRDYRGLATKSKKGFSTLTTGITLNAPILEIIKGCVKLKNLEEHGDYLTCRCPFNDHSDLTPSFTIYKKTDSFYCFGCERGGNPIDFISEFYGISKKKATERLKDEGTLSDLRAGTEEEEYKHKCFFEEDSTLYMQIYNVTEGNYSFAYLKDGIIELTEAVGDTMPVELPYTKEGEIAKIVQMPSENVTTCELLTPPELLKKIKDQIAAYCDLSKEDLELSAYYVLFTWFCRKLNTVGYLRFLADTGKGKSRMLSVIGDLCFYPLSAAGSGSFSGMMRQNELWHGTVIVDEADMGGNTRNQYIKYVNLGMENGKYFILSDKKDPRKQEVFNPFGPKIFGMREPFKDVATEGRLLSISPHETTNANIPILLDREYYERAARLRNEIARFLLEHWSDVDGEKLLSFKDMGIEPRLQQLAMPLSIIFQLWKDGTVMFKNYMLRRQRELKKERAQSWAGSMFNLVYAIVTGEETQTEYSTYYDENCQIVAVTPGMVAKTLKTSAKTATDTLRSIGFEVERPYVDLHDEKGNITNRKRVRCYVVANEQIWREMTQRYFDIDEVQEGTAMEVTENDGIIKIPEVLKSKKFVRVCNVSVPTVLSVPNEENLGDTSKNGTPGTDGTLYYTQQPKNNVSGACAMCNKLRDLSPYNNILLCSECIAEQRRLEKAVDFKVVDGGCEQ